MATTGCNAGACREGALEVLGRDAMLMLGWLYMRRFLLSRALPGYSLTPLLIPTYSWGVASLSGDFLRGGEWGQF